MNICTKCKIDKEDNQYQKYWHSTQNKFRIRKECTECLYKQRNERKRLRRKEAKLIQVLTKEEIVQPVVKESQPDLSNDKNYKQCRTCQEWKLKTEYHSYTKLRKKSFLDCKICLNAKEVIRSRKDREEYLKQNGGSDLHKVNPGEWIDEYQKEATYNILKAMGWKLNKDNGIWWKDGIKTSDGVFINIKKRKYKKRLIFDNYPELVRTEKKKEMFDEMVRMRNEGLSYTQIGDKVGVSSTTVFKWLNNEKH
jgi:hypothetical protein